MGMFKKFFDEHKVTPLVVAFVLAITITGVVQALVNYLLMPILTFFVPNGAWRNAAFVTGSVIIPWGALLSVVVNFILILLVILWIARRYEREDKASKR